MEWGAIISFENPIEWGFELKLHAADPIAVMGRMEEQLTTLAEKLGVPPLGEFTSSTREDWRGWGCDEDEIPASVSDEPQWYSAMEGLATVRALLSAIERQEHQVSDNAAAPAETLELIRVWQRQLTQTSEAKLQGEVRELVAALEEQTRQVSDIDKEDAADWAVVREVLRLWERQLARASELGVRFVYQGFEL